MENHSSRKILLLYTCLFEYTCAFQIQFANQVQSLKYTTPVLKMSATFCLEISQA